MPNNKALIVDDSKTAQHLLARMLKKYPLDIETAPSAEDALLYLASHQPAVIFLDQHMTGMDGIEALKAIRAKPHTALVPVIMYTSQDDDLFVNEAIALGAQGIFSKCGMLPSNLEHVLGSLRIYPIESTAVADASAVAAALVPTARSPAVPATLAAREQTISELERVRSQITRQFEIHGTDLGNQLQTAAQSVVSRLTHEIHAAARREIQSVESSTSLFLASLRAEVGDAIDARMRSARLATRLLLGGALLAVAMTGYLAWWAYGELQQTVANLETSLEHQKQSLASVMRVVPPAAGAATSTGAASAVRAPSAAANTSLLRALSWLQNADLEFDYGAAPLAPERVAQLAQLTQLLAEGGYSGALKFDVHLGNFCLESDHANGWRMARNDLPASACKMLAEINPRTLVADYVTLAYRNFEKTSQPVRDGRIRVELASSGLDSPRTEYPLIRASTTAAEWNRAATKNNRIAVRLAEFGKDDGH